MIDDFLQAIPPGGAAPKALIVPHAGYIYSGPVAASAYARLRDAGSQIRRVVLLGPAHRLAFPGLALSSASAFATPLGAVELDPQAQESLRKFPTVQVLDPAHAQEHSLEVQLPFLQEVLDDFHLVPILVGRATSEEVSAVLELLWGGDETLLLISSDLSHYHDYATAQQLDAATSRAIEELRPEALDFEDACGCLPVCGLLQSARQRGMAVETLDVRNSGDTAGDRNRVVGYGSYAFH
jgi:AmmeMemoRadiSam system protein B